MGRVGDNEPQVHETIDDSFPESDPPSLTPPPVTKARSHLPNNKEEEEDLYYIPSQNHHEDQTATSFPPPNSAFEKPHQQAPAYPTTNTHFNQHVPQHGVQMGQPVMAPPVQQLNVNGSAPQAQDKAWSSELFDCMNDPQNALITAFVPCITFGQIAEIVDYGNTTCAMSGMLYSVIAFCIAMPCLMSCSYRTKMRARFGLIETPAQDWIVHCFCEWCALCQEYRELKHMGFDPAIGWLGNQARMKQQQNQQFRMTPPIGQRMMM